MRLRDKLIKEKAYFVKDTTVFPTKVIMHPQTFKKMCEEDEPVHYYLDTGDKTCYMGMEVVLDQKMPLNEFKLDYIKATIYVVERVHPSRMIMVAFRNLEDAEDYILDRNNKFKEVLDFKEVVLE